MSEPLEFDLRPTRTDYFVYFIRHALFGRWIVWLLPIGFAAVQSFLWNPHDTVSASIVSFLIWAGGMLVGIVVLVTLLFGYRVMQFDEDGLALEAKHVRVSADGIDVTGSNSQGHFDWSRIARVRATSRLVLLRLEGKPPMDILWPRRSLPADGVERVSDLFERSRTPVGGADAASR